MLDANSLDLSAAPKYRKKATVIAVYQAEGATYDKVESWGANQELPGPHYLIAATVRSGPEFVGGRLLGGESYGCAEDQFAAMYESTGRPNEYRKTAAVRALRIEGPFTLDTATRDGNVEVRKARGRAGDWVVLQPGGERQLVRAEAFSQLYEPIA